MKIKCTICQTILNDTDLPPSQTPESFICDPCAEALDKVLQNAQEIHALIINHIKRLKRYH